MNINKKPRNAAPESKASGAERRYGRIRDVEQIYGLKRTTVYNLIKFGHIDSVAVNVTGKRCRARLVDLDSVQAFIEAQRTTSKPTTPLGKSAGPTNR